MSYIASNISLLLIEDLIGDAKAITKALAYQESRNYFNIVTAHRLKDSINILNSEKIDIILLDLSLPDAKDIKALVELKALFPSMPIIVISDHSDERMINRVMENGADYFLSKSESSGIIIKKAINEVLSCKFHNAMIV
ncbi:Swarming motility regulation protein rssB [Rickettsiales bacterium Ac37b]|nr:Swarming motility regulation protein rssB [Rickettsiales bacterium Ac37b]